MLIELLRQAATDVPDQPAVIGPLRSESYQECVARSEAVARGLLERGIERFGCWLQSPADVLVTLAGASAVGAEACVYPADLDPAGVSTLASEFGHRTVVSDRDQALDAAQTVVFEQLPVPVGPVPPAPDQSPVLVLTTGTTGRPKGARHDWARLIAAVRRPDQSSDSRWLLAYNLNQFGALQVVLHVFCHRATLVVPRSSRASDVVTAIREQGVTHVSGTPTFWRLVVGAVAAEDLPDGGAGLRLEQITLGGEPVSQGLLDQLHRCFPDARVSQIYGATEFGTAVSVGDGRSGLPLSVLERDENADVRLRIVDGELQMRSRIGMLGYHQDDQDPGRWRPTGDLVEVRGDRIHFIGRRSDIINVGGVKIHPLPVEELAFSVDGVRIAAVYGRPNPVTGQIVVMDVVAAPGVDPELLRTRITAACQTLPRAAQPRRIRFVESIAMSGQKVLRRPVGSEA